MEEDEKIQLVGEAGRSRNRIRTEHLQMNASLDGRHQFGVGRLALVGGVQCLARHLEHL